jgi:hypothetical protein
MSKPEPISETTQIARAYVHSLEELFSGHDRRQWPIARPPRLGAGSAPAPLPDLAGCRLVRSGYPDIYVVDRDGYPRCIADHETYNRLFRDWSGVIETDRDPAALAEPIGHGTVLVRGHKSKSIYIIDNGYRRLVSGPAVMDKYWFNRERISVMNQTVLESIALGRDWE